MDNCFALSHVLTIAITLHVIFRISTTVYMPNLNRQQIVSLTMKLKLFNNQFLRRKILIQPQLVTASSTQIMPIFGHPTLEDRIASKMTIQRKAPIRVT